MNILLKYLMHINQLLWEKNGNKHILVLISATQSYHGNGICVYSQRLNTMGQFDWPNRGE